MRKHATTPYAHCTCGSVIWTPKAARFHRCNGGTITPATKPAQQAR